MELLAQGIGPRHIAMELGINQSTVSAHISRARVKLKARSTIHLAVMWGIQAAYPDIEYLSWGR